MKTSSTYSTKLVLYFSLFLENNGKIVLGIFKRGFLFLKNFKKKLNQTTKHTLKYDKIGKGRKNVTILHFLPPKFVLLWIKKIKIKIYFKWIWYCLKTLIILRINGNDIQKLKT